MKHALLEMPSPGRRTTEPTILERIASGDPEAVSLLVDRYGALVYSLARAQLDADAAEDVVQDVFIALWRNAARFDPSLSSEPAYVTTVARRRVIDLRRRRGRRPEAAELEGIDEGQREEPPESDPVEIADEARVARDALDKLKPEQRDVLRLSIVEGLTHSEIAAATSLPLGTVKAHARRGLERVRGILARGARHAPEPQRGHAREDDP